MPWDEMDNWMRNDKVPLDAYRLLEVYEAAQSVDASDLKRKATELYPDRFKAQEPEIYVHQSSGRGFWHNGECVRAQYTIYGSKLNAIGVMKDGTAYVY